MPVQGGIFELKSTTNRSMRSTTQKIASTIVVVMFFVASISAQTPMEITVREGLGNLRGCNDQFAGSWRRGSFTGNSNDVQQQTMFLCMGDQLQILGNNDADLSGDPVPATRPGVGYAFYECLPGIPGPDIATIITDPCVATAPPPAPAPTYGIYIDAQNGAYNGDRLFTNTGSLQTFFNNGDPVSLWFTPITLDDFDGRAYENNGPCVNSNIFVAFNIVYLNAIEIVDFTAAGANPLEGSVRIKGGLPQWATTGVGRFYNNIVVELVTNPSIKGVITSGSNVAHDDIINFVVPQPGNYRIRVTDGKACPGELVVTLPQNDVEIILGQQEVSPGMTVCVPITVNNFRNVLGFQFAVTWDPTIIRYNQHIIPNPAPIDNMVINPNGPNGELRVIWDNPAGVSLPDGTVLFEICFEAIGNPGDSSYLSITNRPIPFEVIANDVVANTIIKGGGVKIRIPQNLTVYGRSCSTTGASGSITFSAVGGTPPYSYNFEKSDGTITRMGTITNPSDLITQQNLTPGAYFIEVRDANNNVVSITINVANSEPLFISLNSINPRCFEESNGRVEINSVGGGATPYTFKWSIGQFGGNDIRQLPAGSYGVTVIDDNGCTAAASTTLGVTRVTATFNTTRPTCSGKADGQIQAIPAGGTPGSPAYRYLWSNFTTNQTLSNVSPGCYRVTITDGNNCSFEDQVCLDPIKTLDLDITTQSPTCHKDLDGRIEARAFQNGGTDFPPYIFQWSEGTVVNNPPDRSTISGLAGDRNYSVTVTDQDGCVISRSISLIERPPLSLFLIDKKEVSCGGNGMDGEIQVVGSGGTFVYNYRWNTGSTSGSLSNLTPGIYSVTITDSNGCSVTASYEIALQGPDLTMSSVPVSCPGGSDGSANVSFSFPGNTRIRWSNGSTTNSINNLNAGWYYVTVTASINGIDCDQIDSILVTQPLPLTVVENLTPPTCPGGTDGIIELVVSGGTGTYTFQWAHTPLTNSRLTNQRGGQTYTVTIRDGSICPPLIYSFTMPTREFIRFRFSQLTGVSCPTSSCDGSVFLELSEGAVPGGNFRVEWGNGRLEDNVTSLTLDGLCAGNNIITVTDDNGCVQTNIVNVPGPVPVEIDPNNTTIIDVTCNGDTNGSVTISAKGGTGPYNYFWPQQNVTGSTINNLSPGNIPVQITDARNCRLDTFIVINEPPLLIVQVDPTLISNIGCSGINDGQIGVIVEGGNTGAKNYKWSHGGSDGPIASGLAPGTYTVTVTDSKGCLATASYTLSEPEPIVAVIPTPDEPACFGQTTFLSVSSATGGSGRGYTFSVDNGPVTPIGGSIPVLAGIRQIVVFDDKGCSFQTSITIRQPDPVEVILPEVIEIDLGDTINLDPEVISALNINSYDWTNGNSLSCSNCLNPAAFPSNSTNYRLLVTDANGCTASGTVRVQVNKRRYVFIPDAFTPNGDGLNDIFSIFTGKGVAEIESFRIYNRWGALLYQQDFIAPELSAETGWDGRFNGEMMDMGIFIYTASIRFQDGTVLLYRGEVTLIR